MAVKSNVLITDRRSKSRMQSKSEANVVYVDMMESVFRTEIASRGWHV